MIYILVPKKNPLATKPKEFMVAIWPPNKKFNLEGYENLKYMGNSCTQKILNFTPAWVKAVDGMSVNQNSLIKSSLRKV